MTQWPGLVGEGPKGLRWEGSKGQGAEHIHPLENLADEACSEGLQARQDRIKRKATISDVEAATSTDIFWRRLKTFIVAKT